MRTTIDIDDDLLLAAKELARREGATAGAVVSRLLRDALTGSRKTETAGARKPKAVGGFVPFPARPGIVITNEHINAIRDEEGI